MSKKIRWFGFAALLSLIVSAELHASLIGDTISATGNLLSPTSATIGAFHEFAFAGGLEVFDFGASTLTIHGAGTTNWGGFGFFTFSGFDSVITGLSIASNVGFSGDPLSGFSFTASSMTLHWGNGGSTGDDAALVFNIETLTVPEPASLALLGVALAGLAFSRRQRTH